MKSTAKTAVQKAEKSFATLLRRQSPVLLEIGLMPRTSRNNLTPVLAHGIIRRIIPESRDLQVDFGGKFDGFIRAREGEDFSPGESIKVWVRDFEITSNFSGAEKSLTLKEADLSFAPNMSN